MRVFRFFLSEEDYTRETAFYERDEYRACLPGLKRATTNADCAVVSRSGQAFPPFMVVDHGVTLAQWLLAPRSPSAVLTMALEVLDLLKTLHESGTVHRDIKPHSLLFVLHTLSWRLVDFDIAAPAGTPGLWWCLKCVCGTWPLCACL